MKKYLNVSIPERHPAVAVACAFMVLAVLIRLSYYLPKAMEPALALVHLWMPVAAGICFLAGVALGGRWAKPAVLTALALGVAFFILKAMDFTPIHQTLCTILYLTVLSLFGATVLGYVPTKKLLYPLFGLPLLYHIFVEDTKAYFFANPPVPVVDWLPEISVLCIMAGLLCLSIGLEVKPIEWKKQTGI